MRTWIVVCLILATSSTAKAVEPVEANESTHQAPRRKVMEVDGERGVWFRDDVVDEIMRTREEVLESRRALQQALSLSAIEKSRVDACKEAIGYASEAEAAATEALETAVRRAREAEDERNSWLAGKPGIWLGVGVLTSIAIAIVVDKIQE